MGPEIAIAEMGLSLLGGMASASGAKQQANAQAQASLYQAGVAEENKKIAQQYANYELGMGQYNAQQQSQITADTIGTQKSVQAASGLDVNMGTLVDVRARTAEVGAMDSLTLLANAQRKAFGYQMDAYNFESDAGLLRLQSSNAKKSGKISAASSLLGGVAGAADKWGKMSSVGIF